MPPLSATPESVLTVKSSKSSMNAHPAKDNTNQDNKNRRAITVSSTLLPTERQAPKSRRENTPGAAGTEPQLHRDFMRTSGDKSG